MQNTPPPKKRNSKVTLHDVAKAAGVSVAAVSYVLNRNGSVGEAAAKRVHEAVKALNYRPNQSAKAMRTGKTGTIGLILPDLKNPFFPELAQSIESTARDNSYAVFLVDTQGREATEIEGINHLMQHGVEGIIWCPSTNNDTMAIHGNNIPTVIIDRSLPGYDSVSSDYITGGTALAQYILSKGHKKVGIITGPLSLESTHLRLQGLLMVLNNKAEIVWQIENDFSLNINENTKKYLQENTVSIVIAGNDMIAIGAIDTLRHASISVPNKVSVVGFDDIPWSKIVSPKLTTMQQPLSKIGSEAVKLLVRRINEPDAEKNKLTLNVTLVERDSVENINT